MPKEKRPAKGDFAEGGADGADARRGAGLRQRRADGADADEEPDYAVEVSGTRTTDRGRCRRPRPSRDTCGWNRRGRSGSELLRVRLTIADRVGTRPGIEQSSLQRRSTD